MPITDKLNAQIRRAVKRFEKELGNSDDVRKQTLTTRLFAVTFRIHIPRTFRIGAVSYFDVMDLQTNQHYKVTHYFAHPHFDRTFGWYIEEIVKDAETD